MRFPQPPPGGAPTRYIPASGKLVPPRGEEPARAVSSGPRPGPGAGRPAFLADPFFGPGLAAVAVVLWILGLHPVPPEAIGGLGLVAELSVPTLLSYPLLVAAVVLELLRYRPRTGLLSLYTLVGVLGVYGLQPAVEQVARLPVAWLHAGFADYIATHGDILHDYDARFSWAGFFSLVAMVTRAAGLDNALPLLNWSPVVLAGLAVLGVRALAVSALGNRRAAWIAPWIYLVANWTEQDYFSPQGTAMILMLAALTLTFRHLVRPRLTEPVKARLRARLAPRSSPKARLVAQGSVVLIGLALAPTHQLTPFVLGAMLMLLLVFGRLWPAWMPFVVLGGAVVWFSLGAAEFWSGQLVQMILSPLGDVSSSVDEGILARFAGSPGRLVVLTVRIGITLFVAAMAAWGIWMMWRDTVRSWLLPALCVAPFGLAVAQPYGGEVFMRCFLFALPVMALPAALALERAVTSARRMRWRNRPVRTVLTAAVPWVVLTGLVAGTLTARGGNDAYVSFHDSDIAAASWAVQQAEPGERVDSLVNSVPLSFARVGEVSQYEVDGYCEEQMDDVPALVACLRVKGPDYLVLTEPQWAYLRIFEKVSDTYGADLVRELEATGVYHVEFDDRGSLVLGRTTPADRFVQGSGGGNT